MSGWTRRLRGAVLALATVVALAGGQLATGTDLQQFDFSWGASALDVGSIVIR